MAHRVRTGNGINFQNAWVPYIHCRASIVMTGHWQLLYFKHYLENIVEHEISPNHKPLHQ